MADARVLHRRLESVEGLLDVVTSMRDMAAAYVSRAESTLEATRPYASTVDEALAEVLGHPSMDPLRPPRGRTDYVVVFGGDQGLAGRYNERVVEKVEEAAGGLEGPLHFTAVGERVAGLLHLKGILVEMTVRSPGSFHGIESSVTELAASIFGSYRGIGAGRMFFVFSEYESVGSFEVRSRRILPPEEIALERGGDRSPGFGPILPGDPADLLGPLLEEYFFISLYRTLLESLASENGARLEAMTRAADRIEERLDDIRKHYHSARQEQITSEIIEVVSGAEIQRGSR
ncbi:MAG: FoF1 ATP synthase subunit gamma [bacterium]